MEGLKTLNKIAGFITTITIIGGAYYFYKQNIWRPDVMVISVDYDKGVAVVNANGKEKTLYKNQVLSVGGDFGIRFSGDSEGSITRIELYRNFLTYKILNQK